MANATAAHIPATRTAAREAVAAAKEAMATAHEAVAAALLTGQWVGGIQEACGLLDCDRETLDRLQQEARRAAARSVPEWCCASQEEVVAIEVAQHDLRDSLSGNRFFHGGEDSPADRWVVGTDPLTGLCWCGVRFGASLWRSIHDPQVRVVGILD